MPCNLEPTLLDTARRYHECRASIHWKHESGWSVGIGWSISNRACTHLSASGSHGPPEDCVCIQAGFAGCRFCFFFLFLFLLAERMIKHLIWGFSRASLLLNNFPFSNGERKTCKHTDWMINHESGSDALTSISCSAFGALSNSCPYTTIMPSAIELILFCFASRSTKKVRSS